MSKKCPYCSNELDLGYIQCRDNIAWIKKKQPIAALSSFSNSSIILASGGGVFSGVAVKAYCCPQCKKIIIDYSASQ